MSETGETIKLKLQQIHRALGDFSNSSLHKVKHEIKHGPDSHAITVDFDTIRVPAEKANNVSLLLAAIGSLKDNMKVWCEENRVPFMGEKILNKHKNAAVIHDLWNIDKHGKLNKKPRSGSIPRIEKPSTVLSITGGTEANSAAVFSMSLTTGEITTSSSGSGKLSIELSAKVFTGTRLLGELKDIAVSATDAWEKECLRLGIL